MDLRNLLGKLDSINEGTMATAKKKPTGPKFVGKMKGTDPASAAKDKYVGGSMEESIFKELEQTLQNQPARDLKREFAEFKHQLDERAKQANVTRFESKFTELELAVMEGGHELISEAPVAQPAQQAKPGQPTLGMNVGNQQQQQAQQAANQAKQQADAAKQQQQQQNNMQKGVASLKQAGAAVGNPSQTVQAFDKVTDNAALTPNDKNNIASAGTVLAPIMGNQQLAGKFKDLVNQASTVQKQEQQKQAQQQQQQSAQQPQAPVGASQ